MGNNPSSPAFAAGTFTSLTSSDHPRDGGTQEGNKEEKGDGALAVDEEAEATRPPNSPTDRERVVSSSSSSCSSPHNASVKTIIVVGGGYGGVAVVSSLVQLSNKRKGYRILLIEPQPFMLHKMAAVRAAVVPNWEKALMIPYDKLLEKEAKEEIQSDARECGKGIIVRGRVARIMPQENKVILHSKREYHYDVLIIATGSPASPSPFPAEIPLSASSELLHAFSCGDNITKLYQSLQRAIKQSTRILIVGGGPVGIELAGEIVDALPEKDITLIQDKDSLLSNIHPSVSMELKRQAIEKLKTRGVTLLMGQKIDFLPADLCAPFLSSRRVFTTSTGEKIDTDLVIFATGRGSDASSSSNAASGRNHDELREKKVGRLEGEKEPVFPRSWLNDKGEILVNDFLVIPEVRQANVLAIGDCTAVSEPKLAHHALLHAEIAAKNALRIADNRLPKLRYKPDSKPSIAVSVGQHDELVEVNGIVLGAVLGGMVLKKRKGRDLLSSEMWRKLKQTMPQVGEKAYFEQ